MDISAGFKKVDCGSAVLTPTGSNGEVRAGVHIPTSMRVAVKIINIGNPKMQERAYNEVKALKTVGAHSGVIKLFGTEEEDAGITTFLYLFLELATAGDLLSYIQRRGFLPEDQARPFMKQLVSALSACHTNDIIHRDVKLENILLTKENKLRLSDFGLSVILPKTESGKRNISSFAGSPLYMAPEVFALQPHDEKIDVWSLGVCLYYMTAGSFPFIADSYNNLEECVLFENLKFPANISALLQDLLSKMMHKDPNKRISLHMIKLHPWFLEDERPPWSKPVKTLSPEAS